MPIFWTVLTLTQKYIYAEIPLNEGLYFNVFELTPPHQHPSPLTPYHPISLRVEWMKFASQQNQVLQGV